MADNFLINSVTPRGSGLFGLNIFSDQGDYVYVPQEFVFKGLRLGTDQYFNPEYLNRDYLSTLKPIALTPDLIPEGLKNAGYQDPSQGFLIKKSDWDKYEKPGVMYYSAVDKFAGPVQGIAEKDGNLVYSFAGAGGSNYGIIGADAVPWQTTITRQEGKKNFLGIGGTIGNILGNVASEITDFVAGVPFLPEIVGFATGNPILYGSLKSAQTAGKGGDLGSTLTSGLLGGGGMYAAQGLLGGATTGTEVGAGPGVEINPLPQGNVTVTPISPESALGTGLSTSASGIGLTTPIAPSLPSMGGGTGLLTPAAGNAGIIGQTGLTAAGALPVLGSAGSFINNPEVLGQSVMQAASIPISLNDAFRAARLANSLLGSQQQPQVPNLLGQQQQQRAATGVDYSGILNLLASQRPQRFSLLG